MEPTLIGAIIGALGTTAAMIIKSLFCRNQNSKDRMEHEENLIKLSSSFNNVNQAIDELKNDINSKLDKVEERLDKVNNKFDDFATEQKLINIASLRHSITEVFHSYKGKEEIPGAIYQSTMNLYD